MSDAYGERVRFVTIYIKEAHPEDEWQMDSNEREGVCYPQPRTLADRLAIANDFVRRNEYRIPVLVDLADNRADELYAGWPERFYIVGADGRIAYKGEPGPFGFHPEEVEAWLAERFGDPPVGSGKADAQDASPPAPLR
jgi:type I thyroxine 5'-deiodinase